MDEELTSFLSILVIASVAYGQAIGGVQTQITQWVIDAFRVPRHRRGLTNFAVGLVLATSIAGMAAWKAGDASLVPFGALAGVFGSVQAAKEHRKQEAEAKRAGR